MVSIFSRVVLPLPRGPRIAVFSGAMAFSRKGDSTKVEPICLASTKRALNESNTASSLSVMHETPSFAEDHVGLFRPSHQPFPADGAMTADALERDSQALDASQEDQTSVPVLSTALS